MKNASTTIIFAKQYWFLLCKRSERFPTLRWLWKMFPQQQSFSANTLGSFDVKTARGFPRYAGCEKMHPQQPNSPSHIDFYDEQTAGGNRNCAGRKQFLASNFSFLPFTSSWLSWNGVRSTEACSAVWFACLPWWTRPIPNRQTRFQSRLLRGSIRKQDAILCIQVEDSDLRSTYRLDSGLVGLQI